MAVCFSLLLSPINKLTLMALFAAGSGVYFFARGFQLFGRRRSLGHVPAANVHSASLGPIALSGMATGPHTLNAPITGKACYVYQATVWQRTGSGNQQWQKAAEETLHLPFFIEDASGQLLVEPFGAELDVHADFCAEYGTGPSYPSRDDVPPRVSVFLARHGIAPGRPLRVEERTLEPATPVFIAGTLTANPGIRVRPFAPQTERAALDGSAYRPRSASSAAAAPRPEVIQLSGGSVPTSTTEMTPQGKIAAALTRAGITKPEAWAVAGVPYPNGQTNDSSAIDGRRQSVASEDRPQSAANPAVQAPAAAVSDRAGTATETTSLCERVPSVVVMKGEDDAPFVISCHSQQELIHSLGWKSVAMVIGGAFLVVLGSYVLLLEWHFH